MYVLYFYPRSPCGERPRNGGRSWMYVLYFYPRSPCGERRPSSKPFSPSVIFLSTLSLRRATVGVAACRLTINHFYPRSPCGERHGISSKCRILREHFYPRSPCGERPLQTRPTGTTSHISIHALLAESDRVLEVTRNAHTDFYPRSPCGERQENPTQKREAKAFLSTLSLRRAT